MLSQKSVDKVQQSGPPANASEMPAAVGEEKEVAVVSSLDSVPVRTAMAEASATDLLVTVVPTTDAPMTGALMTDVPMTDVSVTDVSMADDVPMTDVSIVDTSMVDVPGTEMMTTADTSVADALASDLCEVSLDVPESAETVVVSTSNCASGSSPGDVALSEAVTTVLGDDVTVGPLSSGDDHLAIPDTTDALAAVVDSEPAAVETVISTDLPPVLTAPSASVAMSAGSPGGPDRRFVRFNNRDLESLRKLQDELNVRKAGGVPRGPGSPIVIRAELASPQKGLTTQAPQLLVVQKPLPGVSPKKADIRVIHPPGLTVRRQLQMGVPTSVASSTAGGLTKVILQPTGQLVGGTTFQLVGAVSGSGGQTAQPTLVLSSPNRTTPMRAAGTQLVRVAAPGTTSVSAPKGMYVVSPMKLGGKVAMIPINVGKSPQRIAPAPTTSSVVTGLPVGASRVTLAASSTSAATAVRPAAPTTTIVPVPGKMNVLQLKPSGPTHIPTMGNSATRHILVLSAGPPVRKTPYPVRGRRDKHTGAGRSTRHRPIAPRPRFTPIAPAIPRVNFIQELGQAVPRPGTVATVVQSSSSTAVAATTGTTTLVTAASSSSSGSVQVPGGKFHYVRLVTAPASTTQASTTVLAAAKPSTLVPVSAARPLAPATSVVSSTAGGTLPAGVRLTVPIAPAISSHQAATAPVPVSSAHRVLIPAASTSVRPSLPAGQLGSLPTATLISAGGGPMQNAFVVVPAQYVAQFQQSTQPSPSAGTSRVVFQTGNLLGAPGGFVPIAAAAATAPTTASVSAGPDHREPPLAPPPVKAHHINGTTFEDNSRPRKPCNCTKSQCLKLYCDCFANGEFCHSCNCNNCFNNLEHEEERQKAIGACLERNPNAFRPKIGKGKEGDHERRHTKGCNCKRSGCLKNYCECYEAKILCSSMCKCVGCKNFEDSSERKTLMQLADAAEVRVQQQAAARTKMSACDLPLRPPPISETGERLPFAFITQEVVEATCQCLMARADEAARLKKTYADVERSVLEEFGRCLEAIIDSAHRTRGKPAAAAAAAAATADPVEKKAAPVVCAPPPPPPPPPPLPERTTSRRTKTARRMLNL